MAKHSTHLMLMALIGMAVPAGANTAVEIDRNSAGMVQVVPYLQCVPYARQISGIRIFGDAHTWWDQAEGRYARGRAPRTGAVMAFRPHGNMRLGHVAAVSRIVDSRTVLLRHANWSQIDGRRGQIEDNVRAVDVSPENDWSEVRVWYAPIAGLGTTRWPVRGFIYGQGSEAGPAVTPAVVPAVVVARIDNSIGYAAVNPASDPIGDIIARKSRLATLR